MFDFDAWGRASHERETLPKHTFRSLYNLGDGDSMTWTLGDILSRELRDMTEASASAGLIFYISACWNSISWTPKISEKTTQSSNQAALACCKCCKLQVLPARRRHATRIQSGAQCSVIGGPWPTCLASMRI